MPGPSVMGASGIGPTATGASAATTTYFLLDNRLAEDSNGVASWDNVAASGATSLGDAEVIISWDSNALLQGGDRGVDALDDIACASLDGSGLVRVSDALGGDALARDALARACAACAATAACASFVCSASFASAWELSASLAALSWAFFARTSLAGAALAIASRAALATATVWVNVSLVYLASLSFLVRVSLAGAPPGKTLPCSVGTGCCPGPAAGVVPLGGMQQGHGLWPVRR